MIDEIFDKMDEATETKKLISDVQISGRPWKAIVVDLYSAWILKDNREFLDSVVEPLNDKVVRGAPITQFDVRYVVESIANNIGESKLVSMVYRVIAFLSDPMKEAVAWTVLYKLGMYDSKVKSYAPKVAWKSDGSAYQIIWPASVQAQEPELYQGTEGVLKQE